MNNNFPVARYIVGGIAAFIILILVISFFPIVVVPAGERGVVFNNQSGIENRILSEGTHFRTPLLEQVIDMPIRTQATTFQENAGTQDSQSVDVKLTVNWHLDPAYVNQVYQSIGTIDVVVSNVLTNNTQDAIKSSVSKYQALDIQKNRDVVANRAQDGLQAKLKKYHIMVDNVSITNIQFTDQFNQAVENAQVQQQNAKAAQYAVQTAKNNADAAVATANGQAQAQQLLQQALTPALIQKMAIDKWDGKLPTYSSVPIPFLNLGQ